MSGIGKDRLHLAWVSSAEAQRFVEIVTEATASIKALGKFDPEAFPLELAAAEQTLTGETLRWLVGKEVKITTKGDVYGRKWDTNSFESILDSVLEREYQINLILEAIKDGCTSVRRDQRQDRPRAPADFLSAGRHGKAQPGRIQRHGSMQARFRGVIRS